ncbi:unnamed protein product [Closterium sp. Yama58-4]|nr:unnamed protein product [Closterium sp. Yama58-4]
MDTTAVVTTSNKPSEANLQVAETCAGVPSTATGIPRAAESPRGEGFPPGFRFRPTDEELLCYYLRRRVEGLPIAWNAIGDVDLYESEPWELPARATCPIPGDGEWFFFTSRNLKYPSGYRSNRATTAGYWKATGKDRPVNVRLSGSSGGSDGKGEQRVRAGFKKTHVFYISLTPEEQAVVPPQGMVAQQALAAQQAIAQQAAVAQAVVSQPGMMAQQALAAQQAIVAQQPPVAQAVVSQHEMVGQQAMTVQQDDALQ